MKDKTIIIVLLFIYLAYLKTTNLNLSNELNVLTDLNTKYKRSYQWKSKRLRTYLVISLKLDSITDLSRTTRRIKEQDEELNELFSNLN